MLNNVAIYLALLTHSHDCLATAFASCCPTSDCEFDVVYVSIVLCSSINDLTVSENLSAVEVSSFK